MVGGGRTSGSWWVKAAPVGRGGWTPHQWVVVGGHWFMVFYQLPLGYKIQWSVAKCSLLKLLGTMIFESINVVKDTYLGCVLSIIVPH